MKLFSNVGLGTTLALSLLLVGCGGGGGGGGGGTVIANPGAGPGPVNIPDAVAASSCRTNLSSILDASNDNSIPGGVLTDLGSGCDYLIDGRTIISGDVSISPGVNFVLTSDSTLLFLNTGFNNQTNQVSMLGTASAPIGFISSSGADTWNNIQISASDLVMTNVAFAGGGANVSEQGGSVEISALTLAMSNVTVAGGLSNGLLLEGRDTEISVFQNNRFINNLGYGVMMDSFEPAQFLNANNDFGANDGANGSTGIGIDRVNVSAGLIIQNVGVPYQILNSSTFSQNGVDLEGAFIAAGVEIQLPPELGLEFTSVTAEGTLDNPIVFSGINGGEWGGVSLGQFFGDGPAAVLRHVRIENGGSGPGSDGGALAVPTASSAVLEDIQFVDSLNWGLFCSSGSSVTASLTGFSFSNGVQAFDVSTCAEQIVQLRSNTPFIFSNTDAECDYFIVGTMDINSTAQIEPGTTIVFARAASLDIENTVVANGTEDMPITLRGEFETEGSWRGLTINGRGHSLQHFSVIDGGFEDTAGLTIESANGGFNSAPLSTDIIFDNVSVMGSLSDGLVADDNVAFTRFADNAFIGNAGFGAKLSVTAAVGIDATSIYDSAMAANGEPGVRLIPRTGSAGAISLPDEGAILGNIGVAWSMPGIRINRDEVLEFEAGSNVQFDADADIEIRTGGVLNVAGTALEPVTISGPAGDLSGWNGIIVSGLLSATNAEFIGGALASDPTVNDSRLLDATLNVRFGGMLNLSMVTIRDSLGLGITCSRTELEDLMLNQVVYSNNALGDIDLSCGS